MLRRLAAVLLAAPLALGTAAPASADTVVTVYGCYGAFIIYCDPTVSVPVDANGSWSVPVCASSCTWVSVPVVTSSGNPACVRYSDYWGWQTSICV